jgi:hypothetical protein
MTAIQNYFRHEMNSHNRPLRDSHDWPLWGDEYGRMKFKKLEKSDLLMIAYDEGTFGYLKIKCVISRILNPYQTNSLCMCKKNSLNDIIR